MQTCAPETIALHVPYACYGCPCLCCDLVGNKCSGRASKPMPGRETACWVVLTCAPICVNLDHTALHVPVHSSPQPHTYHLVTQLSGCWCAGNVRGNATAAHDAILEMLNLHDKGRGRLGDSSNTSGQQAGAFAGQGQGQGPGRPSSFS